MRHRLLLLLVFAAALCQAGEPDVPAKDDLLFYLSFDSEMKADVSKGAAEPDKLKGSG
ncbi:MAG: hypothetical protein GXP25_03315, partial [Planctomycetes bacterium]|nr:hypothetical protein [Planctomycetota bacterium]